MKMANNIGAFQRKYFRRCEDLKEPLTENQKLALEQVVEESFGSGKPGKERLVASKPFDLIAVFHDTISQQNAIRLCNIIQSYATGKAREEGRIAKDSYEKVAPTESDALEVYNEAHPKLGKGIRFRSMGKILDGFLRDYLVKTGYIKEEGERVDDKLSRPFEPEILLADSFLSKRAISLLSNSVLRYAEKISGKPLEGDVVLTDKDALELYNASVETRGRPSIKIRCFGSYSKILLENYLVKRGLIEKREE